MRHIGNARAHLLRVGDGIETSHVDPAFIGAQQSGDQAQEGCLPRAIGPHQPDDVARSDLCTNTAQCRFGLLGEPFGQAFDGYQGHHPSTPAGDGTDDHGDRHALLQDSVLIFGTHTHPVDKAGALFAGLNGLGCKLGCR